MRTRNHKAEYARRKANAAKRGLSLPQARGHARAGEAPIRARPVASDDRLEAALRSLAKSGKQTAAAKDAGVSPERLRRFLRENALAERVGKSWRITDNRRREMMVLSDGTAQLRLLRGRDQASLNGTYLNAVKSFLQSNDIELLLPFGGQSVIDAKGKPHPLETDPNEIYRLDAKGEGQFHEIYRLVLKGD